MFKDVIKKLLTIPPDWGSQIQCPTCNRHFKPSETHFYCENPNHREDVDAVRTAYLAEIQGGTVADEIAPHFFKTAPLEEDDYPPTTSCDVCGFRSARRICYHCHENVPLHKFFQKAHLIALVGGPTTGKSHFITVLDNQVQEYATHFNRRQDSSESSLSYTLRDEHLTTSTGEGNYDDDYRKRLYRERRPIDKTFIGDGGTLVFRFLRGKEKKMILILDDVAGELYSNPGDIMRRTPWIAEAKGIILLLEPNQFAILQQHIPVPRGTIEAGRFINNVHHAICELRGTADTVVDIPIAVCINKLDLLADGPDSEISPLTRRIPKYLRLDVRSIPGADHQRGFQLSIQEEVSRIMADACEDWGCNLTGLLQGLFDDWQIFGIQVTGVDAKVHLFDIDPNFQSELDNSSNDITPTLRTELIHKGISALSNNLKKDTLSFGEMWRIADRDRRITYRIEKVENQLETYEEKFEKPLASLRVEDPLLWLASKQGLIDQIA
jgi:hypothetical protein